ncbi:MAG: PASTA domain-containing protein [Clostridia bacterium]|nr:PASTA domain-containing protein [Clostridia bacterium]
MKYRIILSKKAPEALILKKRGFRIRGYGTLRSVKKYRELPIEIPALFGFGYFYEPNERIKKDFIPTLKKAIFAVLAAAEKVSDKARETSEKISERLREKRERKPKLPSLLPAFCGALCASLTIALLSLGIIVYKLVIEDYFGSYETVTVPDFVGSVYPSESTFENIDYCNLTINYEYDENVPEGTVISQLPSAGVIRRVYPHKSLCHVTLTVSLGERSFTMNDYSSMPLRETILELKNEAVKFSLVESYSDTVDEGKIISTSPSAGEIFSSDQTVVIYVSLGRETVFVTVPDLYGLTEPEAEAMLKYSGLTAGKVTYVRSELPSGTVVSQSPEAGSAAEESSRIDMTVSAGNKYNERLVPDLYGLSIEEAREKLAEYGLVCGNIYAVANGAPKGTVIAQSPLPSSQINSETVSVDIYVSS